MSSFGAGVGGDHRPKRDFRAVEGDETLKITRHFEDRDNQGQQRKFHRGRGGGRHFNNNNGRFGDQRGRGRYGGHGNRPNQQQSSAKRLPGLGLFSALLLQRF